jgi:hypothetical protein
VSRLPSLSRAAIRARFEQRFTARRMADDYVAVYRELIDAAEPRPSLVARLRAVRDSFALARQPAQASAGRVSGNSSQTRTRPAPAIEASARNAAPLPK